LTSPNVPDDQAQTGAVAYKMYISIHYAILSKYMAEMWKY